MTSAFAWLDHDEAERRRMQEAIALFREHDTIDQLGIGSIRDAFSNLLFPGTSTLHTRARYLLFVPWIYRRLEREHVGSADVAATARRYEIRLIDALLAGGEERDVIGAVARSGLKQLPSEAYWNGLHVLGLRSFSGTRAQYHRSFDGLRRLAREVPRDTSRSATDEPIADWASSNWHPGVEAFEPAAFLDETSFSMSFEEGEFLRDRIVTCAPGTMLASIVQAPPAPSVAFPWQSPSVASLPPAVRAVLALARRFSEVMWGSALLYNLMLAEECRSPDLVGRYAARLGDWAQTAVPIGDTPWDEFWGIALQGNPRLARAGRSRRFVERWFALVAERGGGVATDSRSRELITQREREVKVRQARVGNLDALMRWNGASGAGQLTFRWPVVERMVDDVQKALHPPEAARARA